MNEDTTNDAVLGLEDGTVLSGNLFGDDVTATGELVFATPYTGYEEAMTDPSYAGQLLMFTYSLIGNYGVRQNSFQSDRIQAEALVVRECCRQPSHHNAQTNLDTFLRERGVSGIDSIDTRLLTTTLRDHGVLNAAIIPNGEPEEAVERARNAADISEKDLVDQVSCDEPYRIDGSGPRIAVIDTGVKQNIINCLTQRDYDVVVVPHDTDAGTIRGFAPDGVLFGNGPGDPKRATHAQNLVDTFAGELPIFGICLGSQLVTLGMGGDTYKLPFGHRGGNQPVRHLQDNRVCMTSQNHGFAVDPGSLDDTELDVTAVNPNDDTVEGVASDYLNIHTVQYHPEAAPGPRDAESTFFDEIGEVIANAEA